LETVDVAGISIAYLDEGQGPAVVLAHCSSGNHRMWSALIRHLAAMHRVLAPDLIGYGQSGRWPERRPYEADADVRVLAAIAGKADGGIYIVGHSYGAAMALEMARMIGDRVRGMTLIEPVSFHLLQAGGCDAEARIVEDVARRTNAAMAAGNRRSAAAAYMGFWPGRFRWWLAPKKLKDPVIETVDKVAQEFAAIEGQVASDLSPYRAVRAQTLLIYGDKTRAPAKAVVRILEKTLPQTRTVAVAGAGHMSPLTHRDQINALILDHIAQVEHVAPVADAR
jgi:lipase